MAAGPIAGPPWSFRNRRVDERNAGNQTHDQRPAPGPPRANVENNRRKI